MTVPAFSALTSHSHVAVSFSEMTFWRSDDSGVHRTWAPEQCNFTPI
ncbi:hypothetical protein [Streptomyces sp. NPDC000188]